MDRWRHEPYCVPLRAHGRRVSLIRDTLSYGWSSISAMLSQLVYWSVIPGAWRCGASTGSNALEQPSVGIEANTTRTDSRWGGRPATSSERSYGSAALGHLASPFGSEPCACRCVCTRIAFYPARPSLNGRPLIGHQLLGCLVETDHGTVSVVVFVVQVKHVVPRTLRSPRECTTPCSATA